MRVAEGQTTSPRMYIIFTMDISEAGCDTVNLQNSLVAGGDYAFSFMLDVTYGLKGVVASWRDMSGGAGQYVTPLNGTTMTRLGIIKVR